MMSDSYDNEVDWIMDVCLITSMLICPGIGLLIDAFQNDCNHPWASIFTGLGFAVAISICFFIFYLHFWKAGFVFLLAIVLRFLYLINPSLFEPFFTGISNLITFVNSLERNTKGIIIFIFSVIFGVILEFKFIYPKRK